MKVITVTMTIPDDAQPLDVAEYLEAMDLPQGWTVTDSNLVR